MRIYLNHYHSDITNAEKEEHRKMFVCEFLDKLAASPRTWYLTKLGEIRDADIQCPHVHLTNPGRTNPFKGPGAITMTELCDAADNMPVHRPNVRKALLEACGLLRKGQS